MSLTRNIRFLQCSLSQSALLTSQLSKRNCCCVDNHYDIIIAGGGMVGTTLACTLGKNKKLTNKKILLLEAGKESKWKVTKQYSNRVVAVNPSTYELFNRIGVWQHIAATRFSQVKKLQVWDAVSDSMIAFCNDDLTEPVAYIVENDLIQSSVDKETKSLKNVTVMNEAKIKSYDLADQENPVSTVTLENDKGYTCDLLLGCDGAKSKVRETMNIQCLSWDYHQMGVVATLNLTETADNFVAWQRFLPTGPIAFLPLKENLSSLVWSTNTSHAKDLLALSDGQFVEAINNAIWKSYKKDMLISEVTRLFDGFIRSFNCPSNATRQLPPSVGSVVEKSRAAFPLGFGHAISYVKPGVALVGDAAHRVHPLAGQGVNLGFGDVNALDQILGDSVYAGSKLGELGYLKEYEMQRQRHNVPTMLAVDGLHRLYTTEFTPIVLLRSLGLQITHALEPIKKTIISQGGT